MDPVSNSPSSGPAPDPALGRRSFLGWLTYGLGAIAAAAVGLPFIGYIFGTRKAPVKWLAVGRVTDFPQGQTRVVTFDNPISQPWDGIVAHTGVFVRDEGRDEREADETKAHTFLVLAVNCAPGLPGRVVPGVGPVHVPLSWRRLLRQRRTRSGPPPRGLYRCVYRVKRAGGALELELRAPHYPTLQDTLEQG